ncbi:MAG: TonB-dependent receptor, partial [Chitinophagaceae bacterium]
MKHLSFGATTLLLVLSAASGSAQQSEKELDPISVTSGFHSINTSRSGRNILVIPGEQFRRLPVNSIDELLRYVPGIEIQARGP